MQDEEGKQKGDRLTCHVFDIEDDEDYDGRLQGKNFELHFIASILNFQRQFSACSMSAENSAFEGGLLGQKMDDDFPSNSDTALVSSSSGVENVSSSSGDASIRHDKEEFLEPASVSEAIVVPSLNNSQQKAADDFLMAKDKRIRIVQG